MNPSRIFIERPVGTSLLMVAIMLVGAIAYRFLPLSALPQVDYPTIRVLTLYPGASPEVMTSSVTAPLERQFGQMPGLTQMTSTSSAGASSITLQFDLKLGLDVAEQQVQAAIKLEREKLVNTEGASLALATVMELIRDEDTPKAVRLKGAMWLYQLAHPDSQAKLPGAGGKPLSEMTMEELQSYVAEGRKTLDDLDRIKRGEVIELPSLTESNAQENEEDGHNATEGTA